MREQNDFVFNEKHLNKIASTFLHFGNLFISLFLLFPVENNNLEMDQGKFNIKWKTHHQYLKKLLQTMHEATDFSDITLVSDDLMKFRAHKAVLSACSQVFKSIVEDMPKDTSAIYLRGIQGQDLESILQFVYLGEATLPHDRMNEFIEVTKTLEIIEIFKNVYTSMEETSALDDVEDFSHESLEKEVSEEQETEKQQQEEKSRVQEYDFPCNQCDNVFSTSSNQLKHIKSVHEGLRHKCNLCSMEYTQACHLKKHIQSTHVTEYSYFGGTFPCNQCDKVLSTSSNRLKHTKAIHEGVRHTCTLCNKEYTTVDSLSRHIKSVH